jgi:hypothetical protein
MKLKDLLFEAERVLWERAISGDVYAVVDMHNYYHAKIRNKFSIQAEKKLQSIAFKMMRLAEDIQDRARQLYN